MSENEISNYAYEFMYYDTKELEILQPYILLKIIELLQQENNKLKELCCKYENEHSKEFKMWIYKRNDYLSCKQKINNAIEEIKKELKENHHLSYGVALAIINSLEGKKI